jgi:hypothetical protein
MSSSRVEVSHSRCGGWYALSRQLFDGCVATGGLPTNPQSAAPATGCRQMSCGQLPHRARPISRTYSCQ